MVNSQTAPFFRTKNLELKIQNKGIIHNLSLEIHPGQITGLLGPNGAGKTSLLRLLSGEWSPTSGEVVFLGKPLKEWTPLELGKCRAFLHQESNLDFAFTVMEVVLIGRSPHMKNGERPVDHEIAIAALEAVDMAALKDSFFTSLSGGEKQRVHLARCLAQIWQTENSPQGRCLFLDEPTNNLDLAHQYAVFAVARKAAEEGMAVIIVLHDLNQAFQFCDHLCILNKGQLALEGRPDSMLEDPKLASIFKVNITPIPVANSSRPFLVIRAMQ